MNDMKSMDAISSLAALFEQRKDGVSADISRLATLPLAEYEAIRKQEAQILGMRVSELDKNVAFTRRSRQQSQAAETLFPTVDPWPSPVDGAAVLDEMLELIRRFIVCEDATAQATVLWIVFTWFTDHVKVAPLAVITAPEKRCGKSQLLDAISRMSRRPLIASNVSSAAIFRVIEAQNPTLLIDEADSFLKDNEEMRGIINSGHTRSSAYVLRVVGEHHEAKPFSTWGAKVICGIGSMPETIADRSIPLTLRRKLPGESVERLRHADPAVFEIVRRKLARLAEDAGVIIGAARPVIPDELNDRAQDNWEPLIAIADYVAGHWPQTARSAAVQLAEADKHIVSNSALLLADIYDVFHSLNCSQITTDGLLKELNSDLLKPWSTYNRGNPMTARQLAKCLEEYKIRPQNLNAGGQARPKGYKRSDFNDAFIRYIPGHVP